MKSTHRKSKNISFQITDIRMPLVFAVNEMKHLPWLDHAATEWYSLMIYFSTCSYWLNLRSVATCPLHDILVFIITHCMWLTERTRSNNSTNMMILANARQHRAMMLVAISSIDAHAPCQNQRNQINEKLPCQHNCASIGCEQFSLSLSHTWMFVWINMNIDLWVSSRFFWLINDYCHWQWTLNHNFFF